MTSAAVTDSQIRKALHEKQLRAHHDCPNTLVLNELALAHASARIDVAVLNGCLHGYEIKSAADSLRRLPKQLPLFQECLEKLTIVCSPRHLKAAEGMIPKWCGIVEACESGQSEITFVTHRASFPNENLRADRLAHLLWREEAVRLLMMTDTPAKVLKQPRKILYREIADRFTVTEITAHIKEAMIARSDWRDLQVRASCDG